jgi:sugar-specific transcriptional regulator TrmB
MYSQLFEEIGLSPNEAKIYETLLSTGETSVSEISLKGKIHRRNVYDALNRLIEKRLVFRVMQKGENTFQAVTPNKLLEILKEKENALLKEMPALRRLYETEPPIEAAYIYKGLEGFKNYMRDLVRVGQDTYFLGAKGLWFTPRIDKSFLTDFTQMAKEKKIKHYTLYDPRVPEKVPQALKEVGGEYKILPAKYATPGVTDIFGDYVVTFTSVDVGNFGEDGIIFVMINPELAESYRTWFKFMWDLCPAPEK